MFLLLEGKKNVVTPQIDEDLTADPPVRFQAEVSEVMIVSQKVYPDGKELVYRLLENQLNKAYEIVIDDSDMSATLSLVTIKSGTRDRRAFEVVEIEAGGRKVGEGLAEL